MQIYSAGSKHMHYCPTKMTTFHYCSNFVYCLPTFIIFGTHTLGMNPPLQPCNSTRCVWVAV